ncbi:MAG: hypothetical protein AAGE85_01085 [Pseudomonadota bacterium]
MSSRSIAPAIAGTAVTRSIGVSFVFLLVACTPPADTREPDAPDDAAGDAADLGIADVPDSIEIVEAPKTGVSLGWGWNKADHEPIPTICVEFVIGEEPAQTRYMTMSEVTDSYEVMQSLGMSAEASVKTIGFEAKGKASFAKSVNLKSDTSTFIMNAEVRNGVRYTAPMPRDARGDIDTSRLTYRGGLSGQIRLTPEALRLATQSNRTDFKRMCGTSFVSAIYGGAKITAVLTTETSSRTDKESLSAEMSGSGWGARFKGKVSSKTDTGEESSRFEMSLFQTGGSGDAIPVSREDLLRKLETISLEASSAPKDFDIAITPYEILSNWPKKGLPDRETEFDELASYWGGYNTLYDEIQAILDAPEEYAAVSIDDLGCVSVVDSIDIPGTVDKKALEELMQRYMEELTGGGLFTNSERLQRYIAEMQALSSPPPTVQGADNRDNLVSLRKAQDEILAKLKQMEDVARDCVSKSDTCNFKAGDYRSPYAFRLQLLPPDEYLATSRELIDLFVAGPAKRRCAISPNNPACISNEEVDQWHAKVGLTPVHQAKRPDLYAQLETLLDDETSAQRMLCSDGTRAAPLVSEEPGAAVLWANLAAIDARNETIEDGE